MFLIRFFRGKMYQMEKKCFYKMCYLYLYHTSLGASLESSSTNREIVKSSMKDELSTEEGDSSDLGIISLVSNKIQFK